MPLYRPTELHQFLNESQLRPKKSLSQNFLVDGNIIRKIVTYSNVKKGDFVVEIGPGPGALTEALLEEGASVLAIETDTNFATQLKRLQTSDNRLEVIEADVLQYPIAWEGKAKVISNLPYHICSPILEKMLPLSDQIETMTLMVQKEFAVRMAAKEKCADYSPLSLFVQSYSSIVSSFSVSAQSFFPAPKVESTVITLKLERPDPSVSLNEFFPFMKKAFQKRRKTLSSSLRDFGSLETIQKILKEMGCSPQSRPEELSLEEWRVFFKRLNHS